MSSSVSFKNRHEYNPINVDCHINQISNTGDRVIAHNDNRLTAYLPSPSYSSNEFAQRNFLMSPSTSSAPWYSNNHSNLSPNSLNQPAEQSQSEPWILPTQTSKSLYSDVEQKPYITPTVAYNPSFNQRYYATGNTNSTQSLQPSGRMSNHLINAVELAFNHPNISFDPTKSSLGYDCSFGRQTSVSMHPAWSKERGSSYKGYQGNNPYGFAQFGQQRNQHYSGEAMRDQVSYSCPNCKRVYNWKYNLTRHMRYECGTESRFQCAHCKRCFPHKQNAIHHNIRKHRIHHEKNHLYVENGDVIIRSII